MKGPLKHTFSIFTLIVLVSACSIYEDDLYDEIEVKIEVEKSTGSGDDEEDKVPKS